jgi:hypothetical protein
MDLFDRRFTKHNHRSSYPVTWLKAQVPFVPDVSQCTCSTPADYAFLPENTLSFFTIPLLYRHKILIDCVSPYLWHGSPVQINSLSP